MTAHTPTPWCIPAGKPNGFIICSGDDPKKPGPILMCVRLPLGRRSFITDSDVNDNAAFMVKAANSHDDLVKALQQIADNPCSDPSGNSDIASAALGTIKERA